MIQMLIAVSCDELVPPVQQNVHSPSVDLSQSGRH